MFAELLDIACSGYLSSLQALLRISDLLALRFLFDGGLLQSLSGFLVFALEFVTLKLELVLLLLGRGKDAHEPGRLLFGLCQCTG